MTNKYLRQIIPVEGRHEVEIEIDIYAVLEAFDVRCPARQHAIKKLLCAGIRGKGDCLQDLTEAAASIERAIVMERNREVKP